jgi:glycosyltransferase involved in cell wall biosynthesis
MPDGAPERQARLRRVLHVSPYMAPSAGGPPLAIDRWARHAAAHGWRARVLSTPAMSSDGGQGVRAAAEGRYEVFLVSSALAVLQGAGRKLMKDLVQDANLVHLHTMWCPLNALVASMCRSLRKPYVISPHGMLDPYALGIKALRKRAYFRCVESHAIRGAAGVFFTADEERDLATAQIGRVPNPQVVGLGADVPSANPDELAAKFRSSHPEFDGQKLVAFLGRLHPKKRPEAVIRALPALREREPDAAVLLIGSGDRGYVAKLKRLAEDLRLGNRVHFLGHLAGEEKLGALAASSVFSLPSRQENFAIAVAEALQCGVPVLLTDKINIWREIVAAGAGILLSEACLVEDLARHAAAILGDADRREDMSRKARALAMRAYTWPASAQELCDAYDAILATREIECLERQR